VVKVDVKIGVGVVVKRAIKVMMKVFVNIVVMSSINSYLLKNSMILNVI